jgi:putative holliday junction resolvase
MDLNKMALKGRILACDVGKKRTGCALSDPLRMFCARVLSVSTLPLETCFATLKKMILEEEVREILIGIPLDQEGSLSKQAKWILDFQKKFEGYLRNEIPNEKLPIFRGRDESFTSVEAATRTIGSKERNKHRKAELDRESARIILEEYLRELEMKSFL